MTEIDPALRRAAREATRRMKAAWPARRWERETVEEYEAALVEANATPGEIGAGVGRAIKGHRGDFPPSVADLLEYVDLERASRRIVAAEVPAEPRSVPRKGPLRDEEVAPPWFAGTWGARIALAHGGLITGLLRPYAETVGRHNEGRRGVEVKVTHAALVEAREWWEANGRPDDEGAAERAAVEAVGG